MCRRWGKKNKLTALPSARDRGALRTRTMSQHWPVGNFRVGGNTPTIQTPDMSEEPHHRPRRDHRNLAQGRGPQRQVFVAGVKAGVPSDRSSSLGRRPGSPATGLRRWGGGQVRTSERSPGLAAKFALSPAGATRDSQRPSIPACNNPPKIPTRQHHPLIWSDRVNLRNLWVCCCRCFGRPSRTERAAVGAVFSDD
jgi:hypothetical protein